MRGSQAKIVNEKKKKKNEMKEYRGRDKNCVERWGSVPRHGDSGEVNRFKRGRRKGCRDGRQQRREN